MKLGSYLAPTTTAFCRNRDPALKTRGAIGQFGRAAQLVIQYISDQLRAKSRLFWLFDRWSFELLPTKNKGLANFRIPLDGNSPGRRGQGAVLHRVRRQLEDDKREANALLR